MRIVSLLPSATETLFAIGKGDQVVGVTHECDHPPEAAGRPAVTSDLLPGRLTTAQIDRAVAEGVRDAHTIYRLDRERLAALEPNVVVTQALCRVCAVPTDLVEEAVCTMPDRVRVVSNDPGTLEEVLEGMVDIGRAVGAEDDAGRLVADLRERLTRVSRAVEDRPSPRTAVLEWPDPPYAPGHWVPDMVEAAGGESLLGRSGRPSRRVAWPDVLATDPEVVVLAFCGFDLPETIARAGEIPASVWEPLTERTRVAAVDGSACFSRPGPRLVEGVEMLAWILHDREELRPQPGRGALLVDGRWGDAADLVPDHTQPASRG